MVEQPTLKDYQRFCAGFAGVPVPLTQMVICGEDRHAFLHNFCTVDINSMQPGDCSEGFVLNGKGKLIGHGHFVVTQSEIVFLTIPKQFFVLHEHLDRYIIREDVALLDRTSDSYNVFVGIGIQDRLSKLLSMDPLAENSVQQAALNWEGREFNCQLALIELAGFGLLFSISNDDRPMLTNWLQANEIDLVGDSVFETVRIENRTPRFHVDSGQDNLPQELDRDDKTISFTKGCYLGQETVARLDSLGRVNKVFRALQFDAEVEPGAELLVEEAAAGTVTSVCWSYKHDAWIGLGFAKRKFAKPGQIFDCGVGTAKII